MTSDDDARGSLREEKSCAAKDKGAAGPGENTRSCRKEGNPCVARDKEVASSQEANTRGCWKGNKPCAARSKEVGLTVQRDTGGCRKRELTGERKTFKTRATVLAGIVACNRSL